MRTKNVTFFNLHLRSCSKSGSPSHFGAWPFGNIMKYLHKSACVHIIFLSILIEWYDKVDAFFSGKGILRIVFWLSVKMHLRRQRLWWKQKYSPNFSFNGTLRKHQFNCICLLSGCIDFITLLIRNVSVLRISWMVKKVKKVNTKLRSVFGFFFAVWSPSQWNIQLDK